MKIEKLKIGKYIEDKEKRLFELAESAIENRTKLHVSAPVGTGKTWFAIELIKKYQDKYQFVVLEPLISITTQLENKLEEEDILAFVFNSKTRDELDEWESSLGEPWQHTYLSTIDSAHRLFSEGKLNPDKTIVIIDESHSFLQDGRENFDRTVEAIIDSGCPVIGFSGSLSRWVIDYLFKFDHEVNIEATELPEKRVIQFVETNIPNVIAHVIKEEEFEKVIIWTEVKQFQRDIRDAILKLHPEKRVIVLNDDTRFEEEKVSWNHIIKEEKLPDDVNVAIINKVAQAGININDEDIDLQFLVGKFDPFAFVQYMGRCRKFEGDFHFIFMYYGTYNEDFDKLKLDEYSKYFSNNINLPIKTTINKKIDIPVGLKDVYVKVPDGGKGYVFNKCMYANKIYSTYRDLIGFELVNIIKTQDLTIKFEHFPEYKYEGIHDLIYDAGSEDREEAKQKYLVELYKRLEKDSKYLLKMAKFHSPRMVKEKWRIDKVIDESKGNQREAAKDNVLHLPKSFEGRLRKTIKTADKVNVSMQRLIVAAASYTLNWDDESTKALLDTKKVKVQTVSKLMGALVFYEVDHKEHTQHISNVLSKYKNHISQNDTASGWLLSIKSYITTLTSDDIGDLAVGVNKYVFDFKDTKVKDKATGTHKNRKRLIRFLSSYDEYTKAQGLDNF